VGKIEMPLDTESKANKLRNANIHGT